MTFTVKNGIKTVGFLSRTFLRHVDAEEVYVPMASWNQDWEVSLMASSDFHAYHDSCMTLMPQVVNWVSKVWKSSKNIPYSEPMM